MKEISEKDTEYKAIGPEDLDPTKNPEHQFSKFMDEEIKKFIQDSASKEASKKTTRGRKVYDPIEERLKQDRPDQYESGDRSMDNPSG